MSFISKRERVFECGEPEDLPPRQEGKLKAYASCTDARAWSHFHSDKTEHLVDVIKKDNGQCFKYVPTKAIVDTLLVVKNNEIKRLKRKIEELEYLMGAYDKLELTPEQKCELENAHAVIKTAYKDLTSLVLNFDALNLDVSNFTDGPDSEYFETGKSRGDDETGCNTSHMSERKSQGDDWLANKESKANQVDIVCPSDASTLCIDPRIDEMREHIIIKDAKLSAMKNSLAVMESDVCEPYCIYAHIYTALEKIFGTLCQNSKYRQYLDTLISGRENKCSDIKGRILYKLKILEKFSQALIAPCSQQSINGFDPKNKNFNVLHVETTFSITPSPSPKPLLDSQRAQLVADIMEHDEMKEILSNEIAIPESFVDASEADQMLIDDYSIDTENLNRLKNLQVDYQELMTCYENVKSERDDMRIKYRKYEELEQELHALRNQLREYNSLWNEKEHFRRRSEDVDALKEQYFVLTEETCNLETRLKAEMEINQIKSNTIDELSNENINLEKKINDLTIAYEKEKNLLQCRLKEKECTVMCQDQQIKSLSLQIDRILENEPDGVHEKDVMPPDIALMDEVESLRDQIKNLKDSLFGSEEEKQQLQYQFEEKLRLISDLRLELEDKTCELEKSLQRNTYLEKYTENFRDEVQRLIEENKKLSQEVEEKSIAVGNLMSVVNNKSQEVNRLIDEVENNRRENERLFNHLEETRNSYEGGIVKLENEKEKALSSLQLARKESQELLDKVKRYENYDDLKDILKNTIEENRRLQTTLATRENDNAFLKQELHRFQDIKDHVVENINQLQEEKHSYKLSLELKKKESELLEQKLTQFEGLREQLIQMRESQEKLIVEKFQLEGELLKKENELDDAMNSIHVSRKQSEELLEKIQNSENLKEDLIQLSKEYQKLVNEKHYLEKDLMDRNKDLDNLLQALNKSKDENEQILQKSRQVDGLENELLGLKKAYEDLVAEKNVLQSNFDNKTQEINTLYNTLEKKIEENKVLANKIKTLEHDHVQTRSSLVDLQNKNSTTEKALETVKKGSAELIDKLKQYENLSNEYNTLRSTHDLLKLDKEMLQKELEMQLQKLNKTEEQNKELNNQSQNLIALNDHLEKALITARNEHVVTSSIQDQTADIIREIAEMKKEKMMHQKKIQDLLDKLDESENTISNMTEEVMARDDKIAILQNHINELGDEVRKLHNSLAQVVNTGEQIKDHSYQKIDQSLNKMEAHHSKATHNMKMELAKLKNAKATLEDKISATKQKSDESLREKNKYLSRVFHLQNERKIIASEIKQLEVTAVGQSQLSPDNCSIEEITNSLEKICNSLNEKIAKSSSFKQTLLQVQSSSQLLLSKADEAQKIAEAEKQKIMNEKEEAVAEKMRLEKHLLDLKILLEQQSINDEKMIKDLEAEISNQELIIDNINKNAGIYTAKLKEELKSLQELYENSLAKIRELKEKNENLSEDNIKNQEYIEKIKAQFAEKLNEVSVLQQSLDQLKNTPRNELGIQVGTSSNSESVANQTDKYIESGNYVTEPKDDDVKYLENLQDSIPINKKKPPKKQVQDMLEKNKPLPMNEVQILTANVEPTLDFARNSYLDYKMKQLSMGKIEQYSVSYEKTNSENIEESTNANQFNTFTSSFKFSDGSSVVDTPSLPVKPQLYDIYNNDQTSSSATNSSKLALKPHSRRIFQNSGIQFNEMSGSEDRSLFLIYQDSGTSGVNTNHTNNTGRSDRSDYVQSKGEDLDVSRTNYDLKTKSDISLTKSASPCHSFKSLSDEESNYSLLKESEILKTIQLRRKSKKYDGSSSKNVHDTIKSQARSKSYVSTSRTNSPDLQKESPNVIDVVEAPHEYTKNKSEDVAVGVYDTNTVHNTQGGYDQKQISDFSMVKLMNGSLTKDELNTLLDKIYTDDITAPTYNKELRSLSKNSTTPEKLAECKSKAEQSVMVNIDGSDYYEEKIQQLTRALQNVERDYKHKIEAIKVQYDNNIKHIINEHNEGVKNIQDLHEQTLHDIIIAHDNETENLRSMSIEALRKADKLEKENMVLRSQLFGDLEGTGTKLSSPESRRHKTKCENKVLTLTSVEAFNVKPKLRAHGPCTCCLDVNISETIRNMFEQVDVEQRKIAEHTYLKYIANKITDGNVEGLDAEELSFLHLKVCRAWKNKITKEDLLQKKIGNLETVLMQKQRNARQHIAELDRKVAEEKRRLQVVRDSVMCCGRHFDDVGEPLQADLHRDPAPPPPVPTASAAQAEREATCKCMPTVELGERRSAGDLIQGMRGTLKPKRPKNESSRATLAKLDGDERREKKLMDEPPTRLRRTHDFPPPRTRKK